MLSPENKLDLINGVLSKHPQHKLVYWQSADKNGMAPISKTYLMCLKKEAGVPYISRFIGYVSHREGHKIKYKPGLVRIRNGERHGLVIELEHLVEGETATPAGIRKRLVLGNTSECIRQNKQRDMKLLDEILSVITAAEVADEMLLPRYFIAAKDKKDISLRLTKDAIEMIKSVSGYSAALSVYDNFQRLADKLAHSESRGRVLYPYEYCCGRGVVIADVSDVREVPLFVPEETMVNTELYEVLI